MRRRCMREAKCVRRALQGMSSQEGHCKCAILEPGLAMKPPRTQLHPQPSARATPAARTAPTKLHPMHQLAPTLTPFRVMTSAGLPSTSRASVPYEGQEGAAAWCHKPCRPLPCCAHAPAASLPISSSLAACVQFQTMESLPACQALAATLSARQGAPAPQSRR